MKKSPKHVFKASMAVRAAGGRARHADEMMPDVRLDKASVALFAGIHASDGFTAEAAHRAFAGVKRKK